MVAGSVGRGKRRNNLYSADSGKEEFASCLKTLEVEENTSINFHKPASAVVPRKVKSCCKISSAAKYRNERFSLQILTRLRKARLHQHLSEVVVFF